MVGIAVGAVAGPPREDPAIRDAWLDGRLETAYALNPELSAFDIHADVTDGVVRLSGSVGSEIARDLAVEIAEGMEGVSRVEHRLTISPPVVAAGDDARRSLLQRIDDLTASARVKSNLAANGNTKGLTINVATHDAVVTLTGAVTSRKEKMLAELIARNTPGIHGVRNELAIRGGPSEPTEE
ncbi:MAG TPA: BON domain-containing protein [Pseudomonadales bacterium]